MERLAIWSGTLIFLLHLSCLESRPDLGGHSKVRQNVDGKDNRSFVRRSRGINDFNNGFMEYPGIFQGGSVATSIPRGGLFQGGLLGFVSNATEYLGIPHGGVSDFHGAGVGRRSNVGSARTESRNGSEKG
ncbi:hypothetical protein BV898_12280 [Hypsibius exemplaris]|uniref:Secreted protein n=1 Tax=Hypsibius exemplaris TaxID=2072580 RepID=A0A1W0WE92_HYPEX|nr:hypothetical protein BV898_12280 [Hypsibius exemplaris]